MNTLEFGGLRVHVTGGSDGRGGGAGPLVVLLHGYGAPGVDLVPLGQELKGPTGLRFAFPEAPLALEPLSPLGGRAWWQIDIARMQVSALLGQYAELSRETPHGLPAARRALAVMLSGLQRGLGVTNQQMVLGGFSQGSMLATDAFLDCAAESRYAGLVILSGALINSEAWLPKFPKHAGAPVFLSHGRADPILPFGLAERLSQHFLEAGWAARWLPFSGGHGIPPVVLKELSSFITQVV